MDHGTKETLSWKLTYELYLFADSSFLHGWRFRWTNKNPRWFFTRRRACAYSTSSARSSFAFRGQGINRERLGGGERKFIRHRFVDHPEENCRTTRLCTRAISSCLSAIPWNWFFSFYPSYFLKTIFEEDLQILCFASFVLTFPLRTNNKLLIIYFEISKIILIQKNSNEF